jgi:hypothetical protein
MIMHDHVLLNTQVWVDHGTSHRSSACPEGDLSQQSVKAANFTNTLVAQLILITSALGLSFILTHQASCSTLTNMVTSDPAP